MARPKKTKQKAAPPVTPASGPGVMSAVAAPPKPLIEATTEQMYVVTNGGILIEVAPNDSRLIEGKVSLGGLHEMGCDVQWLIESGTIIPLGEAPPETLIVRPEGMKGPVIPVIPVGDAFPAISIGLGGGSTR